MRGEADGGASKAEIIRYGIVKCERKAPLRCSKMALGGKIAVLFMGAVQITIKEMRRASA